MNKRLYFLMILTLFIMTTAACGDKPTPSGGDKSASNNVQSEDQGSAETQFIKAYFADSQLEKLEEKVVEARIAPGSDKYQQAYTELQNNNHQNLVSLWTEIKLNSLSFSDSGEITLDIHIPNEARLGSSGEQLAIEALKRTLFQFEEVNSIELLVDGEVVESLMGHSELEHPILRNKS